MEKSKEYYQKNKKKCCEYTIREGCDRAIERDRMRASERAQKLMVQFPYENYERYFAYRIRKYGVHEHKYAWQECVEASFSAYLCSIYRCAAENYAHVDRYIKKMGRIFICCAVVLSACEMQRPSWDEAFERMTH